MLDDYLVFARIVEAGSFSAAARALRVSTSKVSKRLAALEDRLGVRLIQRSTRRVSVTSAGEQFYAQVASILAATERAEDVLTGRAGVPSGRLRVSSSVLTGRRYISPLIPSFVRKYPQVRLEFELNDEFVDLQQGYYDLAVRISGVVDQRGLTGHLLATNRRILCCTPEYIASCGNPRSLEDLARHVLLGAMSQFPWRLEGPDGLVTIYGESLVRTNSSEVVRDLLLGGLGIALRSPWDVPEELNRGSLVRIMPAYRGAADVGIYAVHRSGKVIPAAVSAFVDHIRPAFKWLTELPDTGTDNLTLATMDTPSLIR